MTDFDDNRESMATMYTGGALAAWCFAGFMFFLHGFSSVFLHGFISVPVLEKQYIWGAIVEGFKELTCFAMLLTGIGTVVHRMIQDYNKKLRAIEAHRPADESQDRP